jgi:hypothetical protein
MLSQNKFGQSLFVFSNEPIEGLQDIAEDNRQKIAVTIVDDSQTRLLEYLGVDAEDYPVVMISVRSLISLYCTANVPCRRPVAMSSTAWRTLQSTRSPSRTS